MKKDEVISEIILLLIVIYAINSFYIAFSNPELTQTQLFLKLIGLL